MIIPKDLDINFLINLKDPNRVYYSLYLFPSINQYLEKSVNDKYMS